MEISVNENQATNDVININAEQTQQQQAQEIHFDDGVWEDDFTDEAIGAMFVDENISLPPQQEIEQPQGAVESDNSTAPTPQEEAQEETQTEPQSYEVEIFDGQRVNLNEKELQQAVEYGAYYGKNKEQIDKGLQLAQAVQADPNLQAILKAYVSGQPLPNVGSPQAMQAPQVAQQEQAKFNSPNEALQAFEAQLIQRLSPNIVEQVKEAVTQKMIEKYQPFVDNMNNYKEFAEIQKDKDYAEVDNLLTMNIKHKLNEGAITVQQAADIENRLRTDPKFYKEWYGKFKTAMKNKPAQETKTVTAPKVATNSQVSAPPQTWGDLLGKAIEGEDEAIGALFT